MVAVATVALLGVAALLAQPAWVERRRGRVRDQPFPAAWRRILRDNTRELNTLRPA